jgi:hypothetical protein
VVKRDGGIGLRDTVDVGGDAWVVPNGASGDEDGDGEFVSVVVEDELAKLNHGDHVAHAWSWD